MALTTTDLFLVQSSGTSYSISGGNLANQLLPLSTGSDFTSDVTISGSLDVDNLLPSGNFLLQPSGSGSITFKTTATSSITLECANSPVMFKSGTNDYIARLYEPSGNGTSYISLGVSALTDNRIWTFPDAAGTFASTTDISGLQSQIDALAARVTTLEG